MTDPRGQEATELHDFRMPTLGADMEKGTLLEWFVAPGDEVRRGQVIAEIDTEKSAIEIEVFEAGVVAELCVHPGEEVPVGTVLARLRPAAVTSPGPSTPAAANPAPPSTEAVTHSPVVRHLAERLGVELTTVRGTGRQGQITRADVERAAREHAPRVPAARDAEPRQPRPPAPAAVAASPLARRRAAEAGIDLAAIKGTGPHGAVTAADVEAAMDAGALPAAVAPAAASPARPLTRGGSRDEMRGAIGRLMSRSKREIPHYYLATTIDLGPLLDDLRRRNADLTAAEHVMPAAAFLRATALAAAAYPDMNGYYVDGTYRPAPSVRLGVPLALRGGGLVTPVLEGADGLPLVELNTRLRDVATRAKAGRLRAGDLGEPTLTVTSLGERGVEVVYGVIYPPQVALIGFGGIVERPWAVGGLLGVRPVATATLAADHRVSDGHRGALFLEAIATHLTNPEEL
jgi:pyruvate dehydrogenase E2 component (dihydrolipoamide acetyltransferase)